MINDYGLFVLLAITITATPGPAVALTLKNSLNANLPTAYAGIAGNFIAMSTLAVFSATGLSALLTASPRTFTALKVMGCLYMLYLGAQLLWSSAEQVPSQYQNKATLTGRNKPYLQAFKQSFWVGLSNPKALLFFAALFPQFFDPARPYLPQFLTLILTIEGISCLTLFLYAQLAGRVVQKLQSLRTQAWLNKGLAFSFLLFAGLLLLH